MIDENLIMMSVGNAIESSGLFPRIAWPNNDADLALPHVVLELVPTLISDETLNQGNPVWVGFLQATVKTGLDQFDTEGVDMRQQLASLFPSGARFGLVDGTVILVTRHPQPKPAYRDGPYYRLPLQIHLSSDTI